MTTSPPAALEHELHRPPPTLATVLFDLGHRCTGPCTGALDELGAQLWFLRRRFAGPGRGPASLVVVDTSDYEGSRERSRQLMHSINDCLRRDGIRMSERRVDDSGVALALVRPIPQLPQTDSTVPTTLRLVGMA